MADTFDILSLKPVSTPDYMIPAWLGCISWASDNQMIVDAFRAETRSGVPSPRTALDAMIDKATGRNEALFVEFVLWVNENVWGDLGKPVASNEAKEESQ